MDSPKTPPTLTLQTLFTPLLTALTSSPLLFSCSTCNQFLFPSKQLTSLFILSTPKLFCYCIKPPSTSSSLSISTVPKLNDTFLQIDGTQYYEVTCSRCNTTLGHLINLTTLEKQFLCNTILIRNDKVKTYTVFPMTTCKTQLQIDLERITDTTEYKQSESIQNEIQHLFKDIMHSKDFIYKSKEMFTQTTMFKDDMNKILEVIEYIKYLVYKHK